MKPLTLRQAAEYIGVHHATLARWIRDGEGPRAFLKPGKRSVFRIKRIDLDRYIRENSKGDIAHR